MCYRKKKSTLTRAIKIDMPDELRPIYNVCQAALDEILSTDSVRSSLEQIVLGRSDANRAAIKAAVGSVWSKYEASVPAPSKYERILFRHILPNVVSPIIVKMSLDMGFAILTVAGLGFIGIGVRPPTPEWGAMLNEARADMVNAPHVALFPSLAIFFTVLAFNLLGDGLRDALDPKIDRK